MEFKACKKYARISPTKVRPVIDLIRGMPVNEALEVLRYNRKRGAHFVDTVLRSAMANASEDGSVEVDTLYVREARVDEGPPIKRYRIRARMMTFPIKKRTSHITVVLEEGETE